MQLSDLGQVEQIAKKVNFSIFELPPETDFSKFFPKSYHVSFEINENTGKTRRDITKAQIDQAAQIAHNKQKDQLYIVVEHAEALNESASNTFLKALEEPGENIHYIFLTSNANGILPTIRSRANNYYLKTTDKISEPPKADVDIFSLAKEYVSANQKTLPDVVEKILKHDKDDPRATAIAVVSCGIDLMYKSYLLRGNPAFLQKIEKLIATKDALDKNGHVKLQLIANMI